MVYWSFEMDVKHLDIISKLFKNYYCPQTKLRKGNVFTSVCQEFCLRGGGGVHHHSWADTHPHRQTPHSWVDTPMQTPPPGQTPPWADPPPWQTPPRQTPTRQTPPGQTPPPTGRRLLQCNCSVALWNQLPFTAAFQKHIYSLTIVPPPMQDHLLITAVFAQTSVIVQSTFDCVHLTFQERWSARAIPMCLRKMICLGAQKTRGWFPSSSEATSSSPTCSCWTSSSLCSGNLEDMYIPFNANSSGFENKSQMFSFLGINILLLCFYRPQRKFGAR